jgi:hypothetical protein
MKMMRNDRYDNAALALPGSCPCAGGTGEV